MRMIMFLLATVCAVACDGPDKAPNKPAPAAAAPAAPAAPEAPAAAAPAEPAGPTNHKFAGLGLQVDLPPGWSVSASADDMIALQGPDVVMTIHPEGEMLPKTSDEAAGMAGIVGPPKNLKEDKLADGWAVTYESAQGAGKGYIHRKIGDKKIWCQPTAMKAEKLPDAVNVCKGLRP